MRSAPFDVLALALLLGACGGDASVSDSAKSSETEGAPGTGGDSSSVPDSDSAEDSAGDSPADTADSGAALSALYVDDFALAAIVGEAGAWTIGRDLPVVAGDLDGDGLNELLVGFPFRNFTYVFPADTRGAVLAGSGEASLHGAGFAGRSLAVAGDVNGDGYGDVLVGAPELGLTGCAYLAYGPVVGLVELGAAPVISLLGHELDGWDGYEGYSGWSVAGAGDTNGDGFDDVLVSELYNRYVYVVRGPVSADLDLRSDADSQLTGGPEDEGFGMSVDSAGDVDGDGRSDVIVGASSVGITSGAWIFNAPQPGTFGTAEADVAFDPADVDAVKVRGLGDLNGDGYGDIAMTSEVSSHQRDGVLIFSGPFDSSVDKTSATAWLAGEGGEPNSYGLTFSEPLDLDGDGVMDLAVNSGTTSDFSSYVQLMFGPFAGTMDLAEAPLVLDSTDDGDDVGTGLASAGDVDGDGHDDLLVSAAMDDTFGDFTGRVWLMSGATMSAVAGR